MNEIKLQDDIPFPSTKSTKPFEARWPFDQMEPGQSFFIDAAISKPATVISNLSRMNKKNLFDPAVFRGRAVVENGIHGTRVWRNR